MTSQVGREGQMGRQGMDQDSGWRLTGWHVLGALFAFFGMMVTANVIFVYFAVTTFTGVETEDAYRKGLAYNQQLSAAERQASLGWTGAFGAEGPDSAKVITLKLEARDGTPVRGLKVDGRIGRPSTSKFDRDLTFTYQNNGRYEAGPLELAPGQWIVAVEAKDAVSSQADRSFRLKDRLEWQSN